MKTKIEPIADWVSITVDETLSPEARRDAVAAFARSQLDEALAGNRAALGRDTPYEQFVDGRRGAALESVNPDRGSIVFEFELVGDVLAWIFEQLVARSPVLSGTYRSSHLMFADGGQVDPSGALPVAEEYSFTNPVPYSRRLEVGKTKAGRDFLVSVPNRIYERTAADAKARFGNIAKISFTHRAVLSGQQVNQAKAASSGQPWWLGDGQARAASGVLESAMGKKHGKTAHNRSRVRFPTIVVRMN